WLYSPALHDCRQWRPRYRVPELLCELGHGHTPYAWQRGQLFVLSTIAPAEKPRPNMRPTNKQVAHLWSPSSPQYPHILAPRVPQNAQRLQRWAHHLVRRQLLRPNQAHHLNCLNYGSTLAAQNAARLQSV